MDSNKHNDIENLFQSGLNHAEVPYGDGAWEKMELLLDSEKKRRFLFFTWFHKKSFTFKFISIMTLLTIIASLGLVLTSNSTTEKNNTTIALKTANDNTTILKPLESMDSAIGDNPKTTAYDEIEKEIAPEFILSAPNSTVLPKNTISTKTVNPVLSNALDTDPLHMSTIGNLNQNNIKNTASDGVKSDAKNAVQNSIEDETIASLAEKLARLRAEYQTSLDSQLNAGIKTQSVKVIRKTWVNDQYKQEWVYDGKGPIKDFWFGFYYTQQGQDLSFDNYNSGFNLQMMSGNLKKYENVGIYAGLDWGMLFYGKTPNSQVVINTTNQDSGYTRLRSNSMDLHFKVHAEYAKYDVIPYVNFHIGPRFYYTNQKVASYLNLADNESQTHNNADFSTSLTAGAGIGTRVKITPRISLDARYELLVGTKVDRVDLGNSSFNGLRYQLAKNTVSPEYSALRIGIVIDVSEGHYKKTLVKEGHYVESYDSLIVQRSIKDTSSIIVLPCNCSCDNESKSEPVEVMEITELDSTNTEEKNIIRILRNIGDVLDDVGDDAGNSGGGSSGGGKGGFPGIKTNPPVLK